MVSKLMSLIYEKNYASLANFNILSEQINMIKCLIHRKIPYTPVYQYTDKYSIYIESKSWNFLFFYSRCTKAREH